MKDGTFSTMGLGMHLVTAVNNAANRVPPAWPLDASVAVNPFLGENQDTLANVAARYERIAGTSVVMPREWYLAKITSGDITDDDLQEALDVSAYNEKPGNTLQLKAAASKSARAPRALSTIAELSARYTQVDWNRFVQERIGLWASGFFDQGQALWSTSNEMGVWMSWRSWATHDVSPQLLGLNDFCYRADELPESAMDAITHFMQELDVPAEAIDTYMHQLYLSLGGWAQYARHKLWQSELAGVSNPIMIELLAVRLFWEHELYRTYHGVIGAAWAGTLRQHAEPLVPNKDHIIDEILQEAAERAHQRVLYEALMSTCSTQDVVTKETLDNTERAAPKLQAAFCIDVRSEVFRRALESVDSSIETKGFAGFFGLFTKHKRYASDVEENRFPVLLGATLTSGTKKPYDNKCDGELSQRYKERAHRAWGRFKLAAVSSFAFVEAMGPAYVVKLLRNAFGMQKMTAIDAHTPELITGLDSAASIDAAETILKAMSLTTGFGHIVLITGHGANVVNNPFASGLHCGACGGYAGDVNARLLTQLLNHSDVRAGLKERDIVIPEQTLFVAALHDTTTDTITVFDQDINADEHKNALVQVRRWLDEATVLCRAERCAKLPGANSANDVLTRARNWAEVRPEWGLAGCQAFIAAPRTRTANKNLQGRAFLHDYDWTLDKANNFATLELIMTAPVVVASWISLQYYGSSVAPKLFGSGNKLLHNVVGGFGVVEGNGGTLRVGLPWQSVHNGHTLVHEPVRLSVFIAAPKDAMTAILKKHAAVRDLFDNRWLHLFALDDDGRAMARYVGNLNWEPVIESTSNYVSEAAVPA